MPTSVKFHRVEFYLDDLDNQILSRDGLHFVPRLGEAVAIGDKLYCVKFVSYNLDYFQSDHEVWRANVVLATLNNGDTK